MTVVWFSFVDFESVDFFFFFLNQIQTLLNFLLDDKDADDKIDTRVNMSKKG